MASPTRVLALSAALAVALCTGCSKTTQPAGPAAGGRAESAALGNAEAQAAGVPAAKPTASGEATATAVTADGERIIIGFLVKMPDEPWFQNEWTFAQQCADKYGFELIKIGAPDGEKVLNAIDTLAAKGAQGFVICTPDPKLGPAIMARANEKSMKVFTVDDQFENDDGSFMDVPYMGISASDIGKTVGNALWDELQARGWKTADTALCVVTYDELNTVRERTEGTISALKEAGFPEERIYRTAEKTPDLEGGMNATNTLLVQHPDVKQWLVASVNDEGVMGAVRAMESKGLGVDNVIAIGIGGTTAVEEFKKPNKTAVVSTVLIDPYRHGYEATEYMYKWIKDGTEPPKDTRTTGQLIDRSNFEKIMGDKGLL